MLRILLVIAAAALTLGLGGTAVPLKADSWAMPEVAQFASANGQFRLTVTPAKIGSQLEYFRERIAEGEGRTAPPAATATAVLERRLPDGNWAVQWRGPLLNRVAPVRVLVSDDGQRVVTFDDWHGVGTGPHVVAIYDAGGEAVKAYALADLLPENYIAALSRSVSSIQWSKEQRIDATRGVLVLVVAHPRISISETANDAERAMLIANENAREAAQSTKGDLHLEIALDNGALTLANGANWNSAFVAAQRINAEDAQVEARRVRYLTETLLGPIENTERGWHDYLKEAFFRLTPDYLEDGFTSTTVLRDPKAVDYAASEKWVLEEFTDEAEFNGGNVAIASIGPPDNLVRVLRKANDSVPRGSMAKSTVYIAIPSSHRAAAAAAIAQTGARFVWLDPAGPIPQRPERIPGSPAKVSADEIIQRNTLQGATDAATESAEAMR